MPNYAAQRLNMVESQVRANDVTDPRIHDAMRQVPRELFVPSAKRGVAYADAAIEVVRGRYLLEPRTFSKLLQLAAIGPNDAVLDVACGTGYSTAVIARLARTVIGLEQDADLVRIASETLPASGAANASSSVAPNRSSRASASRSSGCTSGRPTLRPETATSWCPAWMTGPGGRCRSAPGNASAPSAARSAGTATRSRPG